MNEEVINDLYNNAVSKGYKKSREEFVSLLHSNDAVMNDMYSYVQSKGYKKDIDDFKGLIGATVESPMAVAEQPKKKEDTVSPFVDGGSELTKFDPRTGQVVQDTPDFAQPKERDFSGLEVKVKDEKILTKQPKVERPIVSGESTKVVSPKTEEVDRSKKGGKSYLENIALNLGLGASYANEAVASIPESIVNLLAIPQNYIAEKTGLPIGVTAEGIKESWGITNPLLDYVKEDQKILSGEVSKFMADRYEDPSIVGNFEKGNYQQGFELLGSAITQSVPVSIGLMIGGAYTAPSKLATVATLGFTENQREELAAMDPTMSEAEKTVKAAGMAAAESVFSSIGTATIGKVYRDIAKREGAEAAKGIFRNGLIETYKKALEKTGVLAGFVGEGIEEAATQITQNVISGKPAFEGAADAFVTGAGSGVVFTAPISAINAKKYVDNKVQSYQTKGKVTEILKDKDTDISQVYNVPVSSEITTSQLEISNLPNSRNLLVNNLKKSVSNGQITDADAKQSLFVFDKIQQVSNSVKDLNISTEDKARVATLLRQRDDIRTKIQNKDDVLVAQEKRQIEDINNQIQEIIAAPKQEVVDEATTFTEADRARKQELEEGITIGENLTNELETLNKKEQDAIQKQAAGEVPVQPGTTVSQEVAQGEPQAEPQGVTKESKEKVRPSISEMAGESVTVRIGNRNVSGIVEVDEGGKATITEGSVIYEIPSDSEFSEFSRPINITKDGDFVVNGDSFNEARIVLEDGKRKALLIRQDGTTKAVTNPRVVEEIEYNIALASLEEMNDADADNLINQYEQQRKTEKPTEGGIDKTISETDEDRKLREAFEEIDLIEEMALMELEDVESQAKLVEHTPKTMKEAKTYLVKKNPDGTYQATLNGRKVARKEVLDDLGKLFEQRASEDISKLQDQTNKLKQEVEEKLFGKEKAQAEPQVQEEVAPTVELTDDQIVEYNRTEEVSDKNGEVLIKVFKSKKFEPTAEPIMTDLGDSVVFEYNNFDDDDDTRTWFIFKKKKDGSITGNGVKVERNRGNLRNTQFFKNYIESKRAELSEQPSAVDTKYTKENLPALNVELQKLFKKQNRLQNQFEKTEDPVVEAELDKTNEELTFLSTKIEELESSVTPEVAAQPKAATKPPVSKKKNREEIISRPAFTPKTLARQWLLSGGKLRSTQSEENKRRGVGVGKGLREETGMGGVEMRQFIGVISNKRGLSPEVAAERIYESLNEELQASMDVQDIRDAIIEVALSEKRKSWIDNQDKETSEDSGYGLSEYYGYDQYEYDLLTDEERADFDSYYFPIDPEEQYFIENAERLAQEYDEFINSEEYQNYIEEIYGSDREGQEDVKNQGDTGSKKQGADGETDFVQAKEQVEENLDELLKLNPKEKSTGQKALDYLDGLLKDYDKIEKEGLGVNIALPVIKKIIQGVRALVKAGMTLSDAINKVAEDNNVSVEDVVNSIDQIDKQRKKAAPSVAKILGKPRKKITVDEMAALKDQIRLEARAARQAKGDLNKKREALAARIIAARRNGYITAAQARTIVNRINRVNLDNPIMVDRLIQYTDKVFDNANYAADMVELRKLQKQARSKNHTSMKDFVDRFTSINPELIPLDRIQDYKEALDFLNNRTPSYARMNDMLPEVESYQVSEEFDAAKTFDALMDKYQNIALNQVGSVEEYVNLIKDINSFKRKAFQLLQNEAIEQEEYDNLIEMVGKDQAEIEKRYEKQISRVKNELIAEIKNQRPKTNPEFTKEENDLIKEYLELSDADLQSLSPEDLFVLNDLLENVSNGEVDYYRLKDVVSKAANNKAGIEVGKQLKASKISLGSAELRKKMAQFESSFWEGLLGLGRATSGPLQKFIISPFNRAIGSFEKFLRDGYNDFLKLKKKYNIKDKQMNKIGMLTTYLQEYMAQFDPKNKGVKDIGNRDWFKQILDSETMRDDYSPEELKIIEEIHESLPKDSDGNVSPEAVYNSYMANDGRFFTKEEKGFFDSIMDWKKENSTSKQKAANEMSGNAFKEIPFHMLRSRYAGQTAQITPTASGDNGMVRIKAGTGKERASEAVGAINTNFEKLFIKGLEQTGRDYFLSKTLKDINNVLASAKKELDGDKDPLVKAISYTLSDALSYEFSDTASQNLLKRLVQARAAMTLFDPIRAGVEFTSTLLSFGLRARTLSGYKNLFGSQGDMKNLLDFTDSPLRLRQNINNAIDINDGRIEPQGMLTKWTTFLSGLPERTMMVTSWMPTFTSEFQRITGEKFDMKKFNDSEAYREKYGKAIKESSAVADAQTEKIIGPTTKAGQRREIIIFPGKTVGRDTVSGQILGFFSNYPYREVTEFVNGFREAGEVLKKGDSAEAISQLQKPLGIALNVAAYGFLSSVVYASRLILLGDDEEEERGSKLLEELMTAKGFIEETAANAAALAASKYAGGGRATLQLLGTLGIALTDNEETKATIKKMLKGSVYVDPLPTQKLSGYGTADKVNTAILKYIPQFVVLSNIIIDGMGGLNEVKSIYEKIEKKGVDALTKDEELRVLALSVVFTATQLLLNYRGSSLPSYNNLKAGMKAVKEDAGVADIAAGKVPAKKKSSGGGGGGGRAKSITKSDLKKYFPEQYNELYGEGSATYEIEQEIKAFEKEQRELKKSIKDQVYGGD